MTVPALSDAEIARRLPVWRIFADLFLDTWFDDDWYRRAAEQLAASGFSQGELKEMLCEEVAPAFIFNLRSVAGEWAGWHDDDIVSLVIASREQRASFGLDRFFARRAARREWHKLSKFMPH